MNPVKAAVSSNPVLSLWLWTVGPDDVESVNQAPAPANFNVLCHSVLISLAKAETPFIRFALKIRNPEILLSKLLPIPPYQCSFILAYHSEHSDIFPYAHSPGHLIRTVGWD